MPSAEKVYPEKEEGGQHITPSKMNQVKLGPNVCDMKS